jgi:uncharacterized protein (DUF302 family)
MLKTKKITKAVRSAAATAEEAVKEARGRIQHAVEKPQVQRIMRETTKAVRSAAATAGAAAKEAGGRIQHAVQKRRVRRIMRETAEAAATAGAAAVAGALVGEVARQVRRRKIEEGLGEPLGFTVHLDRPPAEAIEAVTTALQSEGFGILTRIDVQATLKEKLNRDFRPYTILGACNPHLAHRALAHRAEAGLVLPCNVTVEASPQGGSDIRIGNPDAFLIGDLGQDKVFREVAKEARTRLERAAAALV